MIPFHTLAQRHLVYAYVAVFVLQFGYAAWWAKRWRDAGKSHAALVLAENKQRSAEKKQRSQIA